MELNPLRRSRHRSAGVLAALAGSALLALTGTGASPALASAVATSGGQGNAASLPLRAATHAIPHPRYAVLPATAQAGAGPDVAAANPALTTFTSSFSYGGKTYPYRMVGTDPAKGGATTTTKVQIIPIKIVLSDGGYTTPGPGLVTGSALFRKATFSSGTTQYGDAMQRAEFWKYTHASTYHSLLGTPVVEPALTFTVPAADGTVFSSSLGGAAAEVDLDWVDAKLRALAAKVPADTLPIYITYDTVLYTNGNTNDCCVMGYHSAVATSTGNHTYAYGTWLDSNILGATWSQEVTESHEISEWYNDPYVNNTVPQWSSPKGKQYGCSTTLETGDPVAGVSFQVAVGTGAKLHYQDEVFLSWFTRSTPSIGINGRYTYLGTFSTYAPGC